ncbi:YegS/Rv2252/BmrU family lipid kinase [Geomicrobium halophilum]|uniref:YegS/Rv2252/BmrU family lipid kinase n=1 Tax=Geomicrobium halophilum TaxID=549000 RepID=A0A841Q134_9BACL|nr:diacylglycerol kinase family protein [Geomicrobium halophilum]MBB6451265.1 YegS/Rv2252/BmrU family lipid kinase [Geomicrobium halophilum]
MKEALLIYNGQAGLAKQNDSMNELRSILEAGGFSVTLAPTKQEGDAEEICKNCDSSFDHIFIYGGDGTIHESINGLATLPASPTIGILPGGTCNDFARTLNIPTDPVESLHALLKGKSRSIDIPKANDRFFANFFSVGLIADASGHISEPLKEQIGRLSYFWSALKTSLQPQYYQYRITYHDQVIEGEAALILIANGNHIGSFPLPTTHPLNDGCLNMYIVKDAGLPLLQAWVEAGRNNIKEPENNENDNFFYAQISELQLETTPIANIDTDGEDAGVTPVNITVDTALPFLVPTIQQT